jgi:ABC-type sugar transport system substrate-binding protein
VPFLETVLCNLSATARVFEDVVLAGPDGPTAAVKCEKDGPTVVAEVLLHPTLQAASTIQAYIRIDKDQGPGIEALVAELGRVHTILY